MAADMVNNSNNNSNKAVTHSPNTMPALVTAEVHLIQLQHHKEVMDHLSMVDMVMATARYDY